MKKEKTLLSTKSITLSDTVMVSDPCYEVPTWCQSKISNVLPGRYQTFVYKEHGRCWALYVIHEKYLNKKKRWFEIGEIGVDSGQAGIYAMDTYRNDSIVESIGLGDGDISFFSTRESPLGTMNSNMDDGDVWYRAMCSRTLGEEQWGVYGEGVVARSGMGDGSYPLKVQKDKGTIVGIMIDFEMTYVQAKFLEQFTKEKIVEKT